MAQNAFRIDSFTDERLSLLAPKDIKMADGSLAGSRNAVRYSGVRAGQASKMCMARFWMGRGAVVQYAPRDWSIKVGGDEATTGPFAPSQPPAAAVGQAAAAAPAPAEATNKRPLHEDPENEQTQPTQAGRFPKWSLTLAIVRPDEEVNEENLETNPELAHRVAFAKFIKKAQNAAATRVMEQCRIMGRTVEEESIRQNLSSGDTLKLTIPSMFKDPNHLNCNCYCAGEVGGTDATSFADMQTTDATSLGAGDIITSAHIVFESVYVPAGRVVKQIYPRFQLREVVYLKNTGAVVLEQQHIRVDGSGLMD